MTHAQNHHPAYVKRGPWIGELVMLKSGGPPMEVTNVLDDGSIETVWRDGGHGVFTVAILQPYVTERGSELRIL